MDFDFDLLEDAATGEEIKAIVTDEDKDKLLQLLYRCPYEPRQEEILSLQINNCDDIDEFLQLKRHLLMNRIESKDYVAFGFNYNMGDVNAAIRYMNQQPRKIELKRL